MKIHITKTLPKALQHYQKDYEKEKGWWEYYNNQLHVFVYPFTSLRLLSEYILHEVTEAVFEYYLHLPHSISHNIAKIVEKLSNLLPNVKIMPISAFREFLEENSIEVIQKGDLIDFYYKENSIYLTHINYLKSSMKRYEVYEGIAERLQKLKKRELLKYL